MKPFSLLVKPASADCNLACEYCFYLDHSSLYPETRRHRMSGEVLERMISTFMATDQPQYAFGWQGGEPTLCGVDFFRKVTDLQQKYGRRGVSVANGLQTNATLIDDEFARHLARYNFLVGVSLDGPADVHNRYRKTPAGRGSHARVLAGIRRLAKRGVEFNILTLVSAANVTRPREVYRYLKDSGFMYHQYIPCTEFDEAGRLLDFAITGDEWGEFLCGVFDEWIAGDARRVSVRLFDEILAYYVNGQATVCRMGSDCRRYFVVEYNGDVYPCDFFVEPDLRLGNVLSDSWEDLQASPVYERFGRSKAAVNPLCTECEYLDVCAGDCLKHRFHGNRDPRSLSWLCPGWKRFYAHALPRLKEIADKIRLERTRPPGAHS